MKKKTPTTKKPEVPLAQLPVAMLEELVQRAFEAGYTAAIGTLQKASMDATVGKTTVDKLLVRGKK